MGSVFDPRFQISSVEGKIAASLERVSEVFRVLLWNENKKHHLSPIQIQLLIFLSFHSSHQRTVSALAKEFHLTKATVSDAVHSLETKGLIERERDSADERIQILSLTASGKQTAHEVALFASGIKNELEQLPEVEKTSLLVGLLHLIEGLQKRGLISIQRMCFSCCFLKKNFKNKHPFYCDLLKKPLLPQELRLDCPEHEITRQCIKSDS